MLVPDAAGIKAPQWQDCCGQHSQRHYEPQHQHQTPGHRLRQIGYHADSALRDQTQSKGHAIGRWSAMWSATLSEQPPYSQHKSSLKGVLGSRMALRGHRTLYSTPRSGLASLMPPTRGPRFAGPTVPGAVGSFVPHVLQSTARRTGHTPMLARRLVTNDTPCDQYGMAPAPSSSALRNACTSSIRPSLLLPHFE